MKLVSSIIKLTADILKFLLPFKSSSPRVDWKNHVIFRKFREWMIEVPGLKIPPLKRVFKDILIINLKTWEKKTITMLERFKEREFENDAEFKSFVLDNYEDALEHFRLQCASQGVPVEVLSKFNQWHQDKVEFVRDRTGEIAASCFHKSYESRLDSIFILWSTSIVFTITNAERTIKDVNGSLDSSFRKYNNLHSI